MIRTLDQGGSGIPSRLGRLSATERRVWLAFTRGEKVDLRVGDAEVDNPANADQWGADRVVRGEVVAALLLGAGPSTAGCVGAVRIAGARITGELSVDHGRVAAPLLLQGCLFEGPVNLDEAVTESIDLSGSQLTTLSAYGAHVRGTLDLHDLVVNGTPERAVHADGITVDGSLIADRIKVTGSLCLINAVIGGQVTLNEAELTNAGPEGKALNAGGMRVGRSLLAKRLVASGEVRLPGAHIGSALLFDGATLTCEGADAFNGGALTVASSAYFRLDEPKGDVPFSAHGTVRLVGARIGGGLHFTGAQLERIEPVAGAANEGEAPEEQPVIAASGLVVEGSLYLVKGFSTEGEIRLTGARITGHLDIREMSSPKALLTLYAATALGGIRDSLDSWPGRLNLDGFTYGAFDAYFSPRERLQLLDRMVRRDDAVTVGAYRAQPYEQLAAYYRSLGNDGDARTVLLAKQRAQRARLPFWQRLPGHLLDLLVGYGYRPLRAIGWAVGLMVAGSVYFSEVTPQHVSTEDHSLFNPVLFAADHLVPIIRFGQPEVWQYHGLAAVVTVVLTVLGWTLGIAIAAAASRTLTRS
ncbi:hypothetical protein ABIA33_002931 [Streptacidiphilus sp. MAP12-16]|uniref:hypothetical protein n=1 Tax=Streptacidiphilus sp. MAP12-16 TaxID=3156300 RepID=UPI0035176B5C